MSVARRGWTGDGEAASCKGKTMAERAAYRWALEYAHLWADDVMLRIEEAQAYRRLVSAPANP